MTDTEEIPDDVIATVSDYLDGLLPPEKRPDVESKLESDPLWKRAHEELQETRGSSAISTLRRAAAPETFAQDVTSTIHKRSAGRFFGRKTLGDRVPFGVLLIVALAVALVVAIMMRSSATGSMKPNKPEAPKSYESIRSHEF